MTGKPLSMTSLQVLRKKCKMLRLASTLTVKRNLNLKPTGTQSLALFVIKRYSDGTYGSH